MKTLVTATTLALCASGQALAAAIIIDPIVIVEHRPSEVSTLGHLYDVYAGQSFRVPESPVPFSISSITLYHGLFSTADEPAVLYLLSEPVATFADLDLATNPSILGTSAVSGGTVFEFSGQTIELTPGERYFFYFPQSADTQLEYTGMASSPSGTYYAEGSAYTHWLVDSADPFLTNPGGGDYVFTVAGIPVPEPRSCLLFTIALLLYSNNRKR